MPYICKRGVVFYGGTRWAKWWVLSEYVLAQGWFVMLALFKGGVVVRVGLDHGLRTLIIGGLGTGEILGVCIGRMLMRGGTNLRTHPTAFFVRGTGRCGSAV